MKIQCLEKVRAAGNAVQVQFVAAGQTPRNMPESVAAGEFTAKRGQLLRLHEGNRLLVGLGESSLVNAEVIRNAASTAFSRLRQWKVKSATVDLASTLKYADACVEGAILGNYRFEEYRDEKTPPLASLEVICGEGAATRAVKKAVKAAAVLAEAVNYARQINNLPGNVLYPESLAREAFKMAEKRDLKVTVIEGKELERRGFGGILAVGGGSARPPRLIIIEHPGRVGQRPPVALVGKAITFDTGGISIKPSSSMEEMIYDKSGGTTVLGTMAALADLDYPHPVVGLIASAENMPGSKAYRPGDIVTMYDGTRVEIINTDAEGRMVLGDAIAFARKDKQASSIIDLATLTGACGVALGPHVAGVWSTDERLRVAMLDAGAATGEPLWPMPLREEYDDDIKSQVAAIKNSGGRLAGACTAAAFLKVFAGNTPWLHLDIAFPSALTSSRHGLPKGATGFGVRTLVTYLQRQL